MNFFELKERLTKSNLNLKKLSVISILQITFFRLSFKEDQIDSADIGV